MTDTRARLPANYMTGEDLKESIKSYAQVLGWRVASFHVARRADGSWYTPVQGDKGWPDIVLAKPGHQLIIWECKGEHETLSPGQKDWRECLEQVPGITFGVVRPSDWRDGRIESELR